LKTFGSSIALMLTVALLAVGSAGSAGSTAIARPQSDVFALDVTQIPGTFRYTLGISRRDPATLAVKASIELGEDTAGRYGTEHVWSPNHRRLAIATDTRIRFVNVSPLREAGSLALPSGFGVQFLQWPRPRQVVALVNGQELWRIDPDSAQVVKKEPLRSMVWDARADGADTILLRGNRGSDAQQPWGRGSGLAVDRIEPSGTVHTAKLPRIRTGIEPWRTLPGNVLPPRAVGAVAVARTAFAQRRGVPEGAVQALHVQPALRLQCPPVYGGTGYVITVTDGLSYARYWVSITIVPQSPGTQICRVRDLPARPDLSAYSLLGARPGSWQVIDVPLVLDRAHHRAFVVTSTGPIVEVDLKTMRTRARLPKRALGRRPPQADEFTSSWFTDRPVRLGDRIGISVGDEIKLVGARSIRTVRPKGVPCLVAASGNRLFLYGRTSWSGRFDQCDGVTGLDRNGAVRFRALDSEDVVDIQFGRSYAYAWTDNDIAFLDLRRARVVKRMQASQSRLVLLLPPSRSGQLGDW
jgi:hypothetical protein